jgi:flagellar basal body-associated protein FliL
LSAEKVLSFFFKYKILILILISLIVLIAGGIWLRSYLAARVKPSVSNPSDDIYYSNPFDNSRPTPNIPSPSDTPDNSTSNDNQDYETIPTLTPFPTFAPLPTLAPIPPVTATTTQTSSGNSSCNTGSGVPNSWYSDVYPNPSAASTGNGSITLYVYIRDCNQNTAPVSDSLKISLSSGDSNTQVNGHTLPYVVTAQNGQASFTVTSQVTGTVTLLVQDTTQSFTVTNINNDNPSITFTGSSGNSNCSTANGVPNFWYSEFSPASPISAATGSTVTLTVNIQDCNKNNVSSDNLTLSQTSNDSGLTINGSASPVSVQAQSGQATFNVTSQNAGTDTFTIQDTTGNFTVTDVNNHNPSITFTSSSTPTPTPAPTDTPTPGPTVTPVPTPSVTATPIPTSSPTPTPGQ